MGHYSSITKFPLVLPYTLKGKLLVFALKIMYKIIGFFYAKKWESPPIGFEENPAHYSFKDILYLGYKYYIQPPTKFNNGKVNYFKNQDLNFYLPDDFKIISKVTISVGGDLMPYERINIENTLHLWDDIGDWFFSSDIVFANLETPIDCTKKASTVPEIMLYNMHFNGSQELFKIFSGNGKYKGYDIVSTANNHSIDMGESGIFETIKFLKERGIKFTGTARTIKERNHIPIIERGGIKVAFIAYTYSLNHLQLDDDKPYLVNHLRLNIDNPNISEIKKDTVAAYNNGADIVILSLHTGNAYQSYPSKHTIENYHKIFEECGVDIILGSHPHNPQPMEKFTFQCPITNTQKQGFAIYSLADFVAYDIFVWDRLIPLLKLTITKGNYHSKLHTQLSNVEIMPVYHWGNPKGGELRFFDLKKLIQNGFPNYYTDRCKAEAMYLNNYCDAFLITEKQKQILKSN